MTDPKPPEIASDSTGEVRSPAESEAVIPQADGAEAPVPAVEVPVSGGVAEPATEAPHLRRAPKQRA